MDINELPPSVDLYNRVRAGFVARGSTLSKWCRENEINPTNARSCLAGVWNGPKGKQLRQRLIDESGIATASFRLESKRSV